MSCSHVSQFHQVPLLDRDRHVLNVLLEIAQYSDHAPAAIPAVAYSTGYTASYLEKLIASLRDHGIVKSMRGMKGGYVLARSPEKISVSEILTAGRVTNRRGPRNQSRYEPQVNALYAAIQDIQSAILARISLADILDERAAAHPFLQDVLAGFCRN